MTIRLGVGIIDEQISQIIILKKNQFLEKKSPSPFSFCVAHPTHCSTPIICSVRGLQTDARKVESFA